MRMDQELDNTLNEIVAEIEALPDAPLVERFPDREGGVLIPNHTIADLKALKDAYRELVKEREWVPIRTADDLPKAAGRYLVTSRWSDEDGEWYVCEDRWTGYDWERQIPTLATLEVMAYRPLPPPYAPEGKEQGE